MRISVYMFSMSLPAVTGKATWSINELEAEVPEKNIGTIKKGSDVIVNFPILGKTFNSKVITYLE